MPDSARSSSLHDSAASNVEQDQEDARADHNDANEERRADAGNEEQGDEHEAGAPPPKSVDLTAAKSEVELLTAQLATQGAILAQQRALFHQLQQGAATSAPISASGSMMGLNAELASLARGLLERSSRFARGLPSINKHIEIRICYGGTRPWQRRPGGVQSGDLSGPI